MTAVSGGDADGTVVALLPEPPGPEPVATEPPRRHRRRRIWLAIAIVALILAVIAAVVVPRLVEPSAPGAPWDPRVADLVSFVEQERGLTFDHSVPVEFLSAEAFRKEVTSSEGELTAEDRRELAATEAAFAALGLIPGDADLLDELNTLMSEGVAAFYDPDRERVFVPDGPLTPLLRVTLVHELTHALQDQHFVLTDLDDLPDDEASAYRALVEGDAQRIENAYVAALGPEDAARYRKDMREIGAEVTAELAEIPPFLLALFQAPYVLGEGLLTTLDDDGGTGRIDQAFTDRPTSEEHLMDPFTFLDGDLPIDVPTPALGEGETEVDRGDFGVITWYLLLTERLDPRTALEAVDGWGGDAYIVSEDGDRSCVRAAVQGDDPIQTAELEQALTGWVNEMPPGDHSLTRAGDAITLRSCGSGSAGSADAIPEQALLLPVLRAALANQAVDAAWPIDASRCMAAGSIARLQSETIGSLVEQGFTDEVNTELRDVVPAALAACGEGTS